MRHDVEFPGAGGVTLRGWLYLPEGAAGEVPGIVMAHGFSATKEMGLPAFADRFAAAGYAVLVYDHRCLGASDGEPRQLINIWAQARDYRHAITWLAARPEVDADRIAIWGSSYSGGQVLLVGACDTRVKAVVANVPFAALGGVDYADPAIAARFPAMKAALLDDSGNGPADAPPPPIELAVVEEPGVELPVFLPQPESTEWFLDAGRRPGSTWQNRVLLTNLGAIDPVLDPGVALVNLAPTPVLLVVATEERLASADAALAAFAAAGEPKRLEMVIGHHFADYAGPGLEHAASTMLDFLADVL